MARFSAILATVVILAGTVGPAFAQTPRGLSEILAEMLRMDQSVRGHVVQHREAMLILRSSDDRTYTINTAGLDLTTLRELRDGMAVTVALKRPVDGGMPIAVAAQIGDGPAKAFRRAEGVVEDVGDQRITFVTWEGRRLTLDRNRIIGEAPHVAPSESATFVYEQEPGVAGVWIEPREGESAASPRSEP